MENELALDKLHKQRREQQLAHMKEKMAERKKKKMRKLQNQHESELSEVWVISFLALVSISN